MAQCRVIMVGVKKWLIPSCRLLRSGLLDTRTGRRPRQFPGTVLVAKFVRAARRWVCSIRCVVLSDWTCYMRLLCRMWGLLVLLGPIVPWDVLVSTLSWFCA